MNADLFMTELQRGALTLIGAHRKGNEITGRDVANAIGLKERDTGKEGADMRSVINALRKKGFPICANGKGYYYPVDQKEIDEYVASLEGRIHKAQEALDGVRGCKDIPTPPSLRILEL